VEHDGWRPDLVLMDLRMPGTGGVEAIRLLRRSGWKTPIIALTASGLADTETEARDAGADAFVRKPYRESELLAMIGDLLGVRYAYASPVALPDAPDSTATEAPAALSRAVSVLPSHLIDQLRDAAIQGRVGRLERLADEAGGYSGAAAAAIRVLTADFRYDDLVAALEPHASREDAGLGRGSRS
jgi:CheY-like chemotaxis protein